MTSSRRVAALAMIALAVGCASSGVPTTSKNQNVITEEEIAHTSAANAYELIQHLRPNYLRTRGAVHGAPTADGNHLEAVDVAVYLNETRFGGSEQLRDIAFSDIREVRYFSASEATTKWGTGHSAGAIQILTR
jgi:hypothetical protein